VESFPKALNLNVKGKDIFAIAVNVVSLIEQDDRVLQIDLQLLSKLGRQKVLVGNHHDIGA